MNHHQASAEDLREVNLANLAERATALQWLEDWLPNAVKYAQQRNFVRPGHPGVSKLSPAIRHRVITEYEVAARCLQQLGLTRGEKFLQEIYWRRYWKGWLSLRPHVWDQYLDELENLRQDRGAIQAANSITQGQSKVAIMNHFASELRTTGYLHNHARMWFAAYWIHHERLPWQLGADFFHRYLLDGDPASNTLSWRWVAGLQTPGKTYLARASNLRKFTHDCLLATHSDGLDLLGKPTAAILRSNTSSPPAVTREHLPAMPVEASFRSGLWLHEDDLAVESADQNLTDVVAPVALALSKDEASWQTHRYAPHRCQFITAAVEDCARRCANLFNIPTQILDTPLPPKTARASEVDSQTTPSPLATALIAWANSHDLLQIVTLRPEIGPLHDQLPQLQHTLHQHGIRLALIDRPEDLELRPMARKGFFNYWKTLQRSGVLE